MLKKVTLQFPTVHSLWEFRNTIITDYVEINTHQRTLICGCTEEHIQLALTKFKAKIVEKEAAMV